MESSIAYSSAHQYKNQLILTAITIFVAVVSAIVVSTILVSSIVRGEVANAINNNTNANTNNSTQAQTVPVSNTQGAFTCSELLAQMKDKDGDAYGGANNQVIYKWMTPPAANNTYTYNTTNTENWDISGKVKDSFNIEDSFNVVAKDSNNNTTVNKVEDSNNNTSVVKTEDSNNTETTTVTKTEDSNNTKTEDSDNTFAPTTDFSNNSTNDFSSTTDESTTVTVGDVKLDVDVKPPVFPTI
jgi:hypothetical protein